MWLVCWSVDCLGLCFVCLLFVSFFVCLCLGLFVGCRFVICLVELVLLLMLFAVVGYSCLSHVIYCLSCVLFLFVSCSLLFGCYWFCSLVFLFLLVFVGVSYVLLLFCGVSCYWLLCVVVCVIVRLCVGVCYLLFLLFVIVRVFLVVCYLLFMFVSVFMLCVRKSNGMCFWFVFLFVHLVCMAVSVYACVCSCAIARQHVRSKLFAHPLWLPADLRLATHVSVPTFPRPVSLAPSGGTRQHVVSCPFDCTRQHQEG